MNAKQRWRAVMRGERPDRPVSDFWGTAELTTRLKADLGCKTDIELWSRLGIDKCIYLAPAHPKASEDTWHIPSLFSIWGVETVQIPYMDGLGFYEEAVNPPLAAATTVKDIESHAWPRPDDWDFGSYRQECVKWSGHPIVGASYEPFYLYSRLRGMSQALEDLVVNQEIVDAAMEIIFDIHAGIVQKVIREAGDLIDFIYVAEDLGTQTSLLMSPVSFRRSVKPWLAKMAGLAHQHGKWVFHHDDGAIRPLIPDLIEIGIDLLNPIQWRCKGMDRAALARDFGPSLVFHGGIDNQHTLPFGTPAEVAAQVRENLDLFRTCKGYIVGPCHNLQVNTPTENVVAMYEALGAAQ